MAATRGLVFCHSDTPQAGCKGFVGPKFTNPAGPEHADAAASMTIDPIVIVVMTGLFLAQERTIFCFEYRFVFLALSFS